MRMLLVYIDRGLVDTVLMAMSAVLIWHAYRREGSSRVAATLPLLHFCDKMGVFRCSPSRELSNFIPLHQGSLTNVDRAIG